MFAKVDECRRLAVSLLAFTAPECAASPQVIAEKRKRRADRLGVGWPKHPGIQFEYRPHDLQGEVA